MLLSLSRIAARRVSTFPSRSLGSLGSPDSLDCFLISVGRLQRQLQRQLATVVLHKLILFKASVTCGARRWLYFLFKVLFSLSQLGRYNSILSRSTSFHWRRCCFAYINSIDPSGHNNCTVREDFPLHNCFWIPILCLCKKLCLHSVLRLSGLGYCPQSHPSGGLRLPVGVLVGCWHPLTLNVVSRPTS